MDKIDQPTSNVFGGQATPELLLLESRILIMQQSAFENEVRFEVEELGNHKLHLIKEICKEHDLFFHSLPKRQGKMLVIRKRANYHSKQIANLKKLNVQEGSLFADKQSPFLMVNSCSQTADDEILLPKRKLSSKKAIKKLKAESKVLPLTSSDQQLRMINLTTQTAPDEFVICEWCGKDICPEDQFGHKDMCRVEYRYRYRTKLDSHSASRFDRFPRIIEITRPYKANRKLREKCDKSLFDKDLLTKLNKVNDPNDLDALMNTLKDANQRTNQMSFGVTEKVFEMANEDKDEKKKELQKLLKQRILLMQDRRK